MLDIQIVNPEIIYTLRDQSGGDVIRIRTRHEGPSGSTIEHRLEPIADFGWSIAVYTGDRDRVFTSLLGDWRMRVQVEDVDGQQTVTAWYVEPLAGWDQPIVVWANMVGLRQVIEAAQIALAADGITLDHPTLTLAPQIVTMVEADLSQRGITLVY